MSDIVLNMQTLPDDFADELRGMVEAVTPGGMTDESERLDATLNLARLNGWTLTTLAKAIGVSRERVRQRTLRARFRTDLPEVPLPPRKPTLKRTPPKPRLKIKPEIAERLREMHAVASRVNGATPADHPSRQTSVEFTALLASLADQGVSVYTIAESLGVTHLAVRARLARHGYRTPVPSMAAQTYSGQPTDHIARRAETCKAGHPLSGDNLYVTPKGVRTCRECDRRRGREYRARKRGMGAA